MIEPIEGEDHTTICAVINNFAHHAWNKFAAGIAEHGGTLTHKGGLLHEAENECIDLVIYHHAVRHQLEGVLDALNRGEVLIAKDSLRMMLRGSTKDRLPSAL